MKPVPSPKVAVAAVDTVAGDGMAAAARGAEELAVVERVVVGAINGYSKNKNQGA